MNTFNGSKKFYKNFENDIKFSSKSFCSPVILSAGDFNRYLQLPNYQSLLDISFLYGQDNCFCESRQNSHMINLFFDYDCKDNVKTHDQAHDVIKSLQSKIQSLLPDLNVKFYVKESNDSYINSMHIITHLETSDGYSIYFDYSKGCSQVKHFVSKLNLQHPFDHKQAYSGHLLRLIHSNKFNKDGSLSNRIFHHSVAFSDFNDPLRSLSSYCPNPNFFLFSDYINKHFILQYVKNHHFTKNYLFKDIIQRSTESHLSLTLTEQHTPVCQHKSNNAVCMFYNNSNNHNIIIKCQDAECGKFFQTFFRYDDNIHRCEIITTTDNSSETVFNTQQSSNSDYNFQKDKNMIQDISFTLNKVFLDKFGLQLDDIQTIDNNYFLAIAKSPQFSSSQESRELTGQEKKILFRKTSQGRIQTINQPKELQKALSKVSRQFNSEQIAQYNVQYNQFDNSIHYHYHAAPSKEEKDDTIFDDEFNDIEFKSNKHRQYFTNIINGELQFVTEIYNLEYPDQFLYVYDDKDNGQIMFFDNLDKSKQNETNGGFWNMQGGFKNAKSKIRDYVVELFNDVLNQFNPKDKRKKIVQNKLNQTRNDIYNNIRLDQHLSETYEHREIEFNNNPHLLHFQNGTFDLDQRKFIKTTPEMYNTFQIDYDFDQSVSYQQMYNLLSQIMYEDEFDWFLKQLSNCLNPDKVIEEKQIVILTGKGNNGKTAIYNLMNETLCLDAYSINGRSVMIQAPNQTSSSATPDTSKLIHKRFCYIAELDKKLSFNQQQVKILTGGEKIQTRDLYKSLITFQPCSGIFISCNQIPHIDVTDGGFMNRLKIIDLKYQFVKNPQHQFQKPINKQLLRLIQTVQWKQGFMNLLINYYYKSEIELPKNIQKSIDLRQNLQQNPVHDWGQSNIQFQVDSVVLAEDLRQKYLNDNENTKIGKITFNKLINEYIQQNPHNFQNVDFKKIDRNNDKGDRILGQPFFNCCLKQN